MTTITAWTDDLIEQLKNLWASGASASEIAGELGITSRSAVIGKVHRLGLSGRKARVAVHARVPKPPRVPRPGVRSVPGMPRPPREYEKRAGVIGAPTSLDGRLQDPGFFQRCRFITSAPGGPETLYCGHEAASGSWCAAHYRIVYVPREERAPRRAA